VAVFRRTAELSQTLNQIQGWLSEMESLPRAPFSAYASEARNLLVTARHVTQGALDRKENVGLHYNADLVAKPS